MYVASDAACHAWTVRFSSMMTTTCEYGRELGETRPHGPDPPPEPGGVVTSAAADGSGVLPAPSKASTVYE